MPANYKLVVEGKETLELTAKDLAVGELAEVVDVGYRGDILLRTFDHFVSLNNPRRTWNTDCTLQVRRLAPGTVLRLEVQDAS